MGKSAPIIQQGYAHLLLIITVVGILVFFVIAGMAPFRGKLLTLFPKNLSFGASVTNLLTNGDFEQDFQGWSQGVWTIITSSPLSGVKAAHVSGGTNSNLSHAFSGLKQNTNYKVTFWIKINPQTTCSGDCWGYFKSTINDWNNQFSGEREVNIFKDSVPSGEWVKKQFTFTTKTTTSGDLSLGPFSGTGWTWNVDIDDVKLFEVPQIPIPPTVTVSANKTTVTALTDSVTFTSQTDDPDGTIEYFWDFGDGGRSNSANPIYQYKGNGLYTATLTVYDDTGQYAQSSTTVTVNDPLFPTLNVVSPASAKVDVSNASVSLSGNSQPGSGRTITKVEYSTDRGLYGVASGTTSWSASLNLSNYGGLNKVLITTTDSGGGVAAKTIFINYKPVGKINISNGAAGVSRNNSNIELYDKFEATFDVVNGQYSNPYVPYETNLPVGMPQGVGVSIEATFTSPSGKTYKQPAFLFQPYQRTGNSSHPLVYSGNPVWKIRFSPTELGNWTYSITLTDASGTTIVTGSNLAFSAVTPTNLNNHGFLQVSSTDKRYFEFSDGTPFVGIGPSATIEGNNAYATDTNLTEIASNSANLSRNWMSGSNVAGSSWGAWSANIGNVSNSPGTSMTTEQSYADGVYSLTLPQSGPGANTGNPNCAFFGFYNGDTMGIKQNTNYRVLIRLKTDNITGSGGFTFRPGTNWPESCNFFASSPLVIPYQKGTTDWHVVTGTWNSGNNLSARYGLVTLENVTGGRVYIDEISIREDLGGGNFGPEVLPRSKVDVHTYFAQPQSFNWDYGLDEFAKRGIYEKAVIHEKDDYSYNYMSPSGFGYERGNYMDKGKGANLIYQQYFWRYLIARWGYSRAVHSWEYANEQPPGSLTMANLLAQYMDQYNPTKHMANTSFWCCIGNWWSDPLYPYPDYADTHSYVTAGIDNSTWIGVTDPFTGGSVSGDTALYVTAHSIDQFNKNAGGNKPMIVGEVGIGSSGIIAGESDTDTQGVWWHQFIWSQLNHGGAYFIYWYDKTLRNNNLFNLAVPFRQFMEGKVGDSINKRVPLNNGKYSDIQLTLPTGILGWGQKDTTNGGAHFWIYDRNYTWTNRTGGTSLGGKSVSFGGLPAKQYIVEFWDTWNGNIVQSSNINHVGGTMNLTVPSSYTGKDIAVKIIPATGYPSSFINPTPAPSTTPTPTPTPAKPGDIDGNNKVDIFDYNILLTNFGKTGAGIQGDLDSNNKVDIFDYNILLTNFGK